MKEPTKEEKIEALIKATGNLRFSEARLLLGYTEDEVPSPPNEDMMDLFESIFNDKKK